MLSKVRKTYLMEENQRWQEFAARGFSGRLHSASWINQIVFEKSIFVLNGRAAMLANWHAMNGPAANEIESLTNEILCKTSSIFPRPIEIGIAIEIGSRQ